MSQAQSLDAAARKNLVDSALKQIAELYVFPEKTGDIARIIHERDTKGEFNTSNPVEFADKFSQALKQAAQDVHFMVTYDPDAPPPASSSTPPKPVDLQQRGRLQNFGFKRVEVLPHNIGYIKLDTFFPTDGARTTVASTMNFVAYTDALILDLRENGGGRPDMVALLASYFFDRVQPLTAIHWRDSGKTVTSETQVAVDGAKYLDKKVFILVSKETVSAAEAFTYDMKTLGRVTVVGETTAGGANPGRGRQLNDHFSIFIPTGQAINPITHTNWEHVGVVPDVSASAESALQKALDLAVPAGR